MNYKKTFLVLLMVVVSILVMSFAPANDTSPSEKYNNFATSRNATSATHKRPTKTADHRAAISLLKNLSRSTAPNNTFVVFDKNANYTVGSIFQATIFARNFHDEPKQNGGDFFEAALLRSDVEGDGIAVKIKDHSNGTYTISSPLLWEGQTELKVVLIHSSEGVEAIKLKTSEDYVAEITFRAVTGSKTTEKEDFKCKISVKKMRNSPICNFSNPVYGEPFYCRKPSNGGCESIVGIVRGDNLKETVQWNTEWKEYIYPTTLWQTPVKGSGAQFIVAKTEHKKQRRKLEPCYDGAYKRNLDNTRPSGYFLDKKWHSFLCQNREFAVDEAKKCLRNSVIHVLGDSTIRQWYGTLQNWMKLNPIAVTNKTDKSKPQKSVDEEYNITMYFTSHGPPLQNPISFPMNRYISTSLDLIRQDSPNTIVIITLGLHFLSYRRSFFKERVSSVKRAIENLQRRIPNVKIYIKTLNLHHTASEIQIQPQWLCYQFNKVLFEELASLEKVTIVDTWHMTMVQPPNGVHPKNTMLFHQVFMFLSLVCAY